MYKPETIKKYVKTMQERIEYYKTLGAENIELSISKGNKKIGRVLNVSIAPIITCKNCGKCKSICYDIKAVLLRLNVLNARARNTALLMIDRDEYFRQIENAINRRRTNKYFRWHVGGEIVDGDYFSRMVEIAKRHPDFTFWTYTKMYNIVNLYVMAHGGDRSACIPENFKIMFSEWRGTKLINPYGFPIFSVVFKTDTARPAGYYCPGNCDICKENNRGCIAGENTYNDEH